MKIENVIGMGKWALIGLNEAHPGEWPINSSEQSFEVQLPTQNLLFTPNQAHLGKWAYIQANGPYHLGEWVVERAICFLSKPYLVGYFRAFFLLCFDALCTLFSVDKPYAYFESSYLNLRSTLFIAFLFIYALASFHVLISLTFHALYFGFKLSFHSSTLVYKSLGYSMW